MAKAKKFKLFMGCLGNGVTVCNSAVEEHGDYKTIAHISPGGNIKWYVAEDYVPADDYLKISAMAHKMRGNFLDWFNRLSDIEKYATMLDVLPYTVWRSVLNVKDADLRTEIEMLMDDYLKTI